MISSMRRGSKSPLFLGLLGLIAVAFVVTGINAPGGTGGGLGAQSLASVDGADITIAEVTDQAERRLEQARQGNPNATITELVAAGGIEVGGDFIEQENRVLAALLGNDFGVRQDEVEQKRLLLSGRTTRRGLILGGEGDQQILIIGPVSRAARGGVDLSG